MSDINWGVWGGSPTHKEMHIKRHLETQDIEARRQREILEKQAENLKQNAERERQRAEEAQWFEQQRANEELALLEEKNDILKRQADEQREFCREQAVVEKRKVKAKELKAQAAATAARHIMEYKAICPICASVNFVHLPSDGQVNFDCTSCNANMTVKNMGNFVVYDDNGTPLTSAQIMRAKKSKNLRVAFNKNFVCPVCFCPAAIEWLPTKDEYCVTCSGCGAKMRVPHTGKITVFDESGEDLSPAQLQRASISKDVHKPLRRSVPCPICATHIVLEWLPTRDEYRVVCANCEAILEVEFNDTKEEQ